MWLIGPLLASLVSSATITGKLAENPYEVKDFEGLQGNKNVKILWFYIILVKLDNDYIGFVSSSGSFAIHEVPSGTYVVHVIGSKLIYPSVRVDVARSGTPALPAQSNLVLGAIRARKLNVLSLKDQETISYPLELAPVGKMPYFEKVF